MPKPRPSLDPKFQEQICSEYSNEAKGIIGVSGGRDSMALLHFLKTAGFNQLIVCHLNHQLRGAESDADSDLVARTAHDYGLICELKEADAAELAKSSKQSIELAGRQIRHEFFAEIAAKYECCDVFLGHHADDQVETVLINLFRGSGMRGLGGILHSSRHVIKDRTLIFHRPFLGVWRNEIDRYCLENEIPFRDDDSNFDTEFALRNRIRHQLIPNLAEIFGRDVRGAVERLAHVLQTEETLRETQIDSIFPDLFENGLLDSKRLSQLAEADQFRVVARWLSLNKIPDCGFAEIERVLELLSQSGAPAKINLPGNFHARRRAGKIFLEQSE